MATDELTSTGQVDQLRPEPGHLVGRAQELTVLANAAARCGYAGAARVVALHGPPASGKTTVAKRALLANRARSEDALLYADVDVLRNTLAVGMTDDHRSSRSDDQQIAGLTLHRWLIAIGVAPAAIPSGLDEASALWHKLTADRPVGALIENATTVEHVRSLIPGAGLLVVTSRQQLRGLLDHNATFMPLGRLPEGAGVELVRQSITYSVEEITPLEAAELVRLCGGHPLALRVAAGQINATKLIGDVIGDLQSREREPQAARSTTVDRQVSDVLDSAYAAMAPEVATGYLRLALWRGSHLTLAMASAMLDEPPLLAARVLDVLVDTGLLTQIGPGQWAFPALVRDHARAMPASYESEHERRRALSAALERTLQEAALADWALCPFTERLGRAFCAAAQQPSAYAGEAAALAYLSGEVDNIVAAVHTAVAIGRHELAVQLCETLGTLLPLLRLHRLWEQVAQVGATAAHTCGDPVAEARMLDLLAQAHLDRGDLTSAMQTLDKLVVLTADSGDRTGQVAAVTLSSALHHAAGEHRTAAGELEDALEIFDQTGRPARSAALICRSLATDLTKIGRRQEADEAFATAYAMLGDLHLGADHYQQALTLTDHAQALLLDAPAGEHDTDAPVRAVVMLHEAIEIFEDRPRPYVLDQLARAHGLLGIARHRLADNGRARQHADEALSICQTAAISPSHPVHAQAGDLAARLNDSEAADA